MSDLPTTFGALAGLAFLLGLRHGFDADHLATIDGLTRLHGAAGSGAARWCGTLFSLGHGLVVLAVVLGLSALHAQWQVPQWFQVSGAAVSLTFLLVLGVVNLRAVLAVPQGQMVRPVGLKSRWVRGLVQGRHPIWSVGVGGLFALSFDTLTQAALFAVAGSSYSAAHAALLALMFLAGMLVTDGLNGWWISRLLARADARAARASRVMSAGVAGVSLGVAALGVARWLSPLLDDWADARGALFSAVVVAVVLASYLAARVLARRPQSAWA